MPSTASQYTTAVLMTMCSHRNSPVSDVEVEPTIAMRTTLNYNITNGLRSRDIMSSSDSAVLLATGLSVYGTNSLSNCRRCNMAFAHVAVLCPLFFNN